MLEGEPKNMPSLRLNATGDGKGIIFVGYNGEVHPSGFLPLSLGNVKEENLKGIYTTHPLLVGMRIRRISRGAAARANTR